MVSMNARRVMTQAKDTLLLGDPEDITEKKKLERELNRLTS